MTWVRPRAREPAARRTPRARRGRSICARTASTSSQARGGPEAEIDEPPAEAEAEDRRHQQERAPGREVEAPEQPRRRQQQQRRVEAEDQAPGVQRGDPPGQGGQEQVDPRVVGGRVAQEDRGGARVAAPEALEQGGEGQVLGPVGGPGGSGIAATETPRITARQRDGAVVAAHGFGAPPSTEIAGFFSPLFDGDGGLLLAAFDGDRRLLLVLLDRVAHQRPQHVVALHVAQHGLHVLVDRGIDQEPADGALAGPHVLHDGAEVAAGGGEVLGELLLAGAAVEQALGEPVPLADLLERRGDLPRGVADLRHRADPLGVVDEGVGGAGAGLHALEDGVDVIEGGVELAGGAAQLVEGAGRSSRPLPGR
jgi:hypothetical protein